MSNQLFQYIINQEIDNTPTKHIKQGKNWTFMLFKTVDRKALLVRYE